MLTAVHLLRQMDGGSRILLFNGEQNFARGVAFNPYSGQHLLNVPAAKMGAFPAQPQHFLDWVMQQKMYRTEDRNLVAQAFLPRVLYGQYLDAVWDHALQQNDGAIDVHMHCTQVKSLQYAPRNIHLQTRDGKHYTVQAAVIATGNALPGNPRIANNLFFNSPRYFQNPWRKEAVNETHGELPVLIIGNGLTMVDTVLGLREWGYKGTIISLSPHGYGMLPHRHHGLSYTAFVAELPADADLRSIVSLFNKHRKRLRRFGVSAEPLIDSLRSQTQNIWKRLSAAERKTFLLRLRHLWGVARHRVPLHVHERLQEMRIGGSLQVKAGRLLNMEDKGGTVEVLYTEKGSPQQQSITVSRVINCTGPESNLLRTNDNFLTQCLVDGFVTQDPLNLGIVADTQTFELVNRAGELQVNLFTIGAQLKGELWESTAVAELRVQAEALARLISNRVRSATHPSTTVCP